MTPDEFAEMIANQPGASAGLQDHGPTPPPVTERAVGPREGVSGPDNEPGLDDSRVIGEFVRPDGGVAWLQLDHRATYEAKGFAFTGRTFNREAYSEQVRTLDKWRAIGSHPGENRATWPPQGAT